MILTETADHNLEFDVSMVWLFWVFLPFRLHFHATKIGNAYILLLFQYEIIFQAQNKLIISSWPGLNA